LLKEGFKSLKSFKSFNSSKFTLVALVLMLAGIFLMSSCSNSAESHGENSVPKTPVDPNPEKGTVEVLLYFSDSEAMYLLPERREVSQNNRSLAEIIVNELIKGPEQEERLQTIPEEAELQLAEVVDGIAYVNFSEEISTEHVGGSAGEIITIYSIVNTLVELPEIEAVQLLEEGEKKDAIWKHVYTLEPIEADTQMIDPAYR